MLDPDLPTFVERDKGNEVRRWLRTAAKRGGFLLLVGDSSVGKTRLLFEVARRELGRFSLLAPEAGHGDVVNAFAVSGARRSRLIVWLDEIQRFVEGPYQVSGDTPITAAAMRKLLDSRRRVVVLGTTWRSTASELRASDIHPTTGQRQHRYPAAADILNDRRCHEITLGTFSTGERFRAAQLAQVDPRLRSALADSAFGVTEVLAGVPQVMRKFEQATATEQAVLFAAIDARRLGVQAPLTEPLLGATARGYLTAQAPTDDWVPHVLAALAGQAPATNPLIRILSDDLRRIVGFDVVDFLRQKAIGARRHEPLPAATWQALVSYPHNLEDLARLAQSAYNRWRYCYSLPLYARLAELDESIATEPPDLRAIIAQQAAMASLSLVPPADYDADAEFRAGELADRGDADQLRALAERGDLHAARYLDDLLMAAGSVDELRMRSDSGDWFADGRLAYLFARRGDLVALLAEVNAGNQFAGELLADLLEDQNRPDEASRMRRYGLTADGTIATPPPPP